MAPIAPGRRLRQEEPDTGAAGGDARVPVEGAITKPRICAACGASGSEGWSIIRAAPSAKRRAFGAASQQSLRDAGRADGARQG